MRPEPVILIDSREQSPLPIRAYPVERVGLAEGDYTVAGLGNRNAGDPLDFIVERKSLGDLAGSLGNGRARFERELNRLACYRFKGLLIEGIRDDVLNRNYVGEINPKAILESLAAFEVRFSLIVKWTGSAAGAAAQLECWVRHLVHGHEKIWKSLTHNAQAKLPQEGPHEARH